MFQVWNINICYGFKFGWKADGYDTEKAGSPSLRLIRTQTHLKWLINEVGWWLSTELQVDAIPQINCGIISHVSINPLTFHFSLLRGWGSFESFAQYETSYLFMLFWVCYPMIQLCLLWSANLFQMAHSSRVLGLCLLHATGTAAGLFESLKQKVSNSGGNWALTGFQL